SRTVGAMYGSAWGLAFAANSVVQSSLQRLFMPSWEVSSLMWASSSLLVLGLMYLLGAMVWRGVAPCLRGAGGGGRAARRGGGGGGGQGGGGGPRHLRGPGLGGGGRHAGAVGVLRGPPMTEPLDPVIHAQARLRVMVALSTLGSGDRLTFPRLQQLLDMTAG